VHGADAVIVGQDHPKVVRGGAFVAAVHLVDAYVGFVVVLVGFVGDSWVDGEVVFVAAAGHADVGHRAAGTITEHGPADPWGGGLADSHALGGVQGGCVSEGDVLAQVVTFEDNAGLIGEPLGGDPPGATVKPASLWRLTMMSPARTF
jgi:hypothetical protein